MNLDSNHIVSIDGKLENGVYSEGVAAWWDGRKIPIRNAVLRFVGNENYAKTFGFQWKCFATDQYDSRSNLKITAERVRSCTKWDLDDLKGKNLLEAGCGAGRFTEVFKDTGARIFCFDYSDAIDTSMRNNGHRPGLVYAQADILDIPTPPESFDYVFCYGVIQHVPDPKKAFLNLVSQLKPGGQISVDCYLKDGKIQPWKAKYLWRWITVHIPAPILLGMVWVYIPLWLPFDTVIRRIPVAGKYLASIIPCFNWLRRGSSLREGVRRTVLDTFDALSPKYDLPQTLDDVRAWCVECGLENIDLFEGSNGLVANAEKPSHTHQ